ncbi:MAG: sigma-70 family RNA polymerase sigma factor [Elusimicrobiaceae bacterium]|nr:sigma-70 family RNA polymerase sigma factor [Elusimicrobiaceae bacterium]
MEQENSLDSINEYFKQLNQVTREIDREENARLWALAKKGNAQARRQILESNLRLVIPTAKRFLRPGMDLMDLIEEGNLGLLQAIEKFEPSKGYRFSTYAVYWIEQYIRKYIEEQSGAIKIPSHAWGNLKRWFRAWNELKEANGRDPSLQEMAQELDLTARQVKSIVDTISAAKGIDSLATVVYSEEDMTLEDVLSDDGKGNPHEAFLKQEDHKHIRQSMADLNDRDRQVVILRYGLDDAAPKTLGEVAELLGLSRERVRQIEERAIGLLRREAMKAGILEPVPGDFRTRKLHSAMRSRVKTNILGEETPQDVLGRLLHRARKVAERAKSSKRKEVARKKKKTTPTHKRTTVKKTAIKPVRKGQGKHTAKRTSPSTKKSSSRSTHHKSKK